LKLSIADYFLGGSRKDHEEGKKATMWKEVEVLQIQMLCSMFSSVASSQDLVPEMILSWSRDREVLRGLTLSCYSFGKIF